MGHESDHHLHDHEGDDQGQCAAQRPALGLPSVEVKGAVLVRMDVSHLESSLVDRGVWRHARHQRVASALAGEHRLPQLVRRGGERVGADRRLEDPVAPFELGRRAARGPSRNARRKPRPRRMAGGSSLGVPPSTPTSSKAISAAAPGSSNSARTISAEACTGPPTYRGSSSSSSDSSSDTASPTLVSEGRLRTRPSAPSSECSTMSTTVRKKLGSRSPGPAISSCPRVESMCGERSSHPPAGPLVPGRT